MSLPLGASPSRGKKGKAHGSVKPRTRRTRRKNGSYWKTTQYWYKWQDKTGKHSQYLPERLVPLVEAAIAEGMVVAEILALIEREKRNSPKVSSTVETLLGDKDSVAQRISLG